MKRYPAILGSLYNTPQLITAAKIHEIDAFIRPRAMNGAAPEPLAVEDDERRQARTVATLCDAEGNLRRLTAAELEAGQFAAEQVPGVPAPQEFVAVLPLFGTIFQHGGMDLEYSGGTSTEQYQRQFRRLDQNAAIKTIIIETHSPGGQCIGVEECAAVIRMAREAGATRIVSIANSVMASAAVWIGTAAKEVYVTPGGEIGSIGVVSLHWDYSKAYEDAGIKPTLIATSRAKVLGNEFEPLDDETRAMFEDDNQVVYQRFVKAMAANRGVTPKKVESDFGGGGMLWATDAVKAGLADGVLTMQQLMDREVGRLNKAKGGKAGGRKSMANEVEIARARLDD